ncbi:MAG: hypothetical protein WKG07_11740 [Hymenobacter sp.]
MTTLAEVAPFLVFEAGAAPPGLPALPPPPAQAAAEAGSPRPPGAFAWPARRSRWRWGHQGGFRASGLK